jgi:carbonic anhydrase
MHDFHHFIARFHHFKQEFFLKEVEFFARLHVAQEPKALVIACSDSRVDPAILLDCQPGEFFTVRNVAALVPAAEDVRGADAVMAAVEYGLKHLNIEHVIVMGHSSCGGIAGLIHQEKIQEDKFVLDWVRIAEPVFRKLADEYPDAAHNAEWKHVCSAKCEKGAVLQSIDNLLSYPWVEERVEAGKLKLHGWYYDMAEGDLLAYSAEEEDFIPMVHGKHLPQLG